MTRFRPRPLPPALQAHVDRTADQLLQERLAAWLAPVLSAFAATLAADDDQAWLDRFHAACAPRKESLMSKPIPPFLSGIIIGLWLILVAASLGVIIGRLLS